MAEKLTRKEKIAIQKQSGGFSTKQIEKQNTSRKSLRRILGLLAAIAGFLLYANTLGHDYVLDDYGLIKENTQVKKGISVIPEIFQTSYRFGMNITDYQLYRPLTKAMFAVEWDIAPNTPALSHFMNVLLFAFLCYMIFRVLNRYMNDAMLVPFITALLFASHPVHTEVVANIKSRDEIVAFLLCLTSLWFFHSYVTDKNGWGLMAGIASYFLALFSKESAITFLVIIPLFFYFFTEAKRNKYISTLTGMAIVTIIFLMIRKIVLGSVESLIPVEDNSLAGIDNFLLQKVNAIYIMGVYLKLFVYPNPLIADGSYNHFPVIGFTSWKFLLPFMIFLSAFIYAIIRFRKKDPVSFAILFFFVTVSIVSNVVVLIGTNYGERLMFVPSFGFCMLAAILIARGFKSSEKVLLNLKSFIAEYSRPLLVMLFVIILFSVQTMARNYDWKDNITLYKTDVLKVPDSAHMLFYLANHITSEDYYASLPDSAAIKKVQQEAIDYLSRSVTIFPKYADGYQRRGFIYSQLGKFDLSENDYKKALIYNPTHPIVYNNYGSLCFNLRRYEEALQHFQMAVKYNPNYAHALNNLASVYGVFGIGETEAMTKDPANKDMHARRARENFETANSYYTKSINADPNFAEPYRLMGITHMNLGNTAEGEKFKKLYEQISAETKNAEN
jgi:tetratricopeptide (TPR) repeat protein